MAEGGLKCAVQHGRAHVQEGLHRCSAPAHLLRLVHALCHDRVDRALHERGRDRLTMPTPSSVMHQRCLVALEIAQKLADVLLKTAAASHVTHRRALRPAAQGRELAPAPCPAPVPQAPLRAVQAANRFVSEVGVGHLAMGQFGGAWAGRVIQGPALSGAPWMSGIEQLAEMITTDLEQRLPGQRKTQRDKLALLVATMLQVRSANLMDVAACLPRPAERLDSRYQWIKRFLANTHVVSDAVMAPYGREVLARLSAQGQTV